MSVDAIKRMINSILELPAMPNVVTVAINVIQDPKSGAVDLANAVENDHAITAQLLKIVNSPFIGLSQNVQTVNQAITLLGFNEVKNIILSCAMKPMMTSQTGKELWEHALTTAVGSEVISKKLGRRDTSEAFTYGLMHDLGKIVFELYKGKGLSDVKSMIAKGTDILLAEKMVFGFDHTEVGYELAQKWKLPAQIASVMRYHHKPHLADFKANAGIVYIADRLAQANIKDPILEPEIMKKIGLDINKPDVLRSQVTDKARVLLRSFNCV